MNEQIKLLKHQASVWCDENIPDQYSEETNGYGRAWEDKFAELIVKECSGFVYNYPEKYLTRNQAREVCLSMEEHFGVEQ